jgi:2'-5' RNA ligase
MRLFIAVELPEEVRRKIANLIKELKETGAGVKWVEADNLHITLKFLGWVEDQRLEDLESWVVKAVTKTGGFKAKFEGTGAFPPGKNPRVLWVGINEGGKELKKIADSLEGTLARGGYRSEEREFSAHLTLGRVKDKAPRQDCDELSRVARGEGVDKLIEKIEQHRDASFGEAWIDSIAIMKSTLTPKGPVYDKIKEVKL